MTTQLPVARDQVVSAIAEMIKAKGIDNLTPKNIRQQLGEQFSVDFTAHKNEINNITREQIEELNNPKPTPTKNGRHSDSSSDESLMDDGHKKAPKPRKKRVAKNDSDAEDDDLMSRVKRRRATAPKTRKTTKKPKDENAPKKRTAFTKICSLSDELTEMLGRRYMTRSDVVSCMWSYFRDNDLMDPKDKRMVRCDSKLKDLFKKDKVLAFGIMKFLGPHITEAHFETEEEKMQVERDVEEFQRKRKEEKEKAGGKKTTPAKATASTSEPLDRDYDRENSSVASSVLDQADDEDASQNSEDPEKTVSEDSDGESGENSANRSESAEEESD
ncbi:hypothetical protein L596_018082 [Steinernema carpocapsae]|uniref:Uncharacterized protein n=1 Tax=Steinernema carpocapsae TaxID=34508 RepID=A0A4U5N4C6_STECR|nr:hypothetical protein L596_018082 [Steinernema carpocapsae]